METDSVLLMIRGVQTDECVSNMIIRVKAICRSCVGPKDLVELQVELIRLAQAFREGTKGPGSNIKSGSPMFLPFTSSRVSSSIKVFPALVYTQPTRNDLSRSVS